MINKEIVKMRFSRSAKDYDAYAHVQKDMGDKLLEGVKKQKDIKTILEIGCGTGYITKALITLFPDAKITAVDIAPGMVEYTQSIVQSKNIKFICDDIEEITLTESYDLIISNATFQWFNALTKTLEKLIKALSPNGALLFSTFGENTFKELHASFNIAKRNLALEKDFSPGQSFCSASELEKICYSTLIYSSMKHKKIKLTERYYYEYFKDCKEFLYSVKKIGASNAQNLSNTNIDLIKEVIKVYNKTFQRGDKVLATYHSLFICIQNEPNK